ncbi:hypothetical protein [Bacillus sp. BPN334]|uniref:hypothetical protein n=1 Tax=Bacillus sp. BPN334 TaxID=2217815 RepID=UPI0011EE69C4|nr:hypothetical protein [Bacillus sp. BPN334]KAA0781264.1 hypothetical protein DN393_30065 [Bacillus sp. BPN334]
MNLETLKQAFSNAISNQHFSDHIDNVTKRAGGYCKGLEFWIDGKMGIVEFTDATLENGVFTGNIKVTYQGHYKLKNFHVGYGCGYKTETKDPKGTVEFKVIRSIMGTSIEEFRANNTIPSQDHDSTKMSIKAIQEKVLSPAKLGNLI